MTELRSTKEEEELMTWFIKKWLDLKKKKKWLVLDRKDSQSENSEDDALMYGNSETSKAIYTL